MKDKWKFKLSKPVFVGYTKKGKPKIRRPCKPIPSKYRRNPPQHSTGSWFNELGQLEKVDNGEKKTDQK